MERIMPRKLEDLEQLTWKFGESEIKLLKQLGRDCGDAYIDCWDALAFRIVLNKSPFKDTPRIITSDCMWGLAHYSLKKGKWDIKTSENISLWDTVPSYTNGYEWSQDYSRGRYVGDLIIGIDNTRDKPQFYVETPGEVKVEEVTIDSW